MDIRRKKMKRIIIIISIMIYCNSVSAQDNLGSVRNQFHIDTTNYTIYPDTAFVQSMTKVELDRMMRKILRDEFARFIDRLLYSRTADTLRFIRAFDKTRRMK